MTIQRYKTFGSDSRDAEDLKRYQRLRTYIIKESSEVLVRIILLPKIVLGWVSEFLVV